VATAELIVECEPSPAQPHRWTLPALVPELDGIRGLAILLVLICHSAIWLPASPLRTILIEGRIGVDLFFVLSGFLITGILLDTQRDRHATRNFYIRRGLRIWPLYFAFLLIAFTVLRPLTPARPSPWIYALFAQNFFYFANTGPLLDPTWSLAVEEQFYLFWPCIALHARTETVFKICCAVVAASPLIRILAHTAGANSEFLYANTLCRLDGIALGGAVAAWIRMPNFNPSRLLPFAQRALAIGALGAAVSYWLPATTEIAIQLRPTFLALAFAGLLVLALAAQGTKSPFARIFRSFPFAGLGRISFALYLFNLPIYTAMHGRISARLLAHVPWFAASIVLILVENAILLAAALCSWKFFERPILRLKSRWAPREPKTGQSAKSE